MGITLGVVMDPIHSINVEKDTTLALLLAAQERGWQIKYMEQKDLFLDEGVAKATTKTLTVMDSSSRWFTLTSPQESKLGELDVILMRKDPPFDSEYIYATYILDIAQQQGALVVNDPQSLRDCNEKVFTTHFPQCCPPLMVSRDMEKLRVFHTTHKDVIFKPLDGMGGSGIFRCKPDGNNLNVILETLTLNGHRSIMAQRYIPEIRQGDKRILVVDGQAIPYCLARIPPENDNRGNLAVGGSGEPRPLTERDHWIVSQVAPVLKEKKLLFVGLDVIGDYLTEINVTSPTCVREIDKAFNTRIGEKLMKAIEQLLHNNQKAAQVHPS